MNFEEEEIDNTFSVDKEVIGFFTTPVLASSGSMGPYFWICLKREALGGAA